MYAQFVAQTAALWEMVTCTSEQEAGWSPRQFAEFEEEKDVLSLPEISH